jgi:MFS family permease
MSIPEIANRLSVGRIAVYTMLQDVGHAAGALLAGLPVWLAERTALGGAGAHRAVVLGCAACGAVAIALYALLGPAIERARAERPRLTGPSRSIIAKISALFALDSLGGGFLTTALVSYFFFERFGSSETAIAALFFGARLMNAGSHLAAAWLARRIGLVNTMVFTHLPSNLLLLAVPFMPTLGSAIVVLLARFALSQMDVPTRQAYIAAMVDPEERTAAAAFTNTSRYVARPFGPAVGAILMNHVAFGAPFVAAGALKSVYDLVLWRVFKKIPLPEDATPRRPSG